MIHLSSSAASEIRRLRSKQQQPNLLFRLSLHPGGCSGWYYDMSFEPLRTNGDRLIESQGIQIIIDEHSLVELNGLTLDYSEDLMGGGFRFHNPQATATCNCGNSFSMTEERED